jgi:hypothetical protein
VIRFWACDDPFKKTLIILTRYIQIPAVAQGLLFFEIKGLKGL